jgi:hypothetical protein
MATKKQNTLIGRKCVIDFACRWKGWTEPTARLNKAEYMKRDDWNKTGEIVSYEPEHETGKDLVILRDDTGNLDRYFHGEITITGPAADPAAEVIALLKAILAKL